MEDGEEEGKLVVGAERGGRSESKPASYTVAEKMASGERMKLFLWMKWKHVRL
jgi:hypothetical protein